MNGFREKTGITEVNFEEMCLLAEDVMNQLYMNFSDYDAEGNDIFTKHYRKDGDFEKDSPLLHKERMAIMELPESHLLYDLFRRGDDLTDVRYYTLEEIRPWIEPIIPKALHLFRKGTNDCGETLYMAADSVPDDYLIAAFAREVRNMMMIFAGQKLFSADAARYLLLLERPETHGMGEWRGIYFDDENLKKAYDELAAGLEEEKKADPGRQLWNAAIWEFCPRRKWEDASDDGQGAQRAGQKIRAVRPEELRCFRKIDSGC